MKSSLWVGAFAFWASLFVDGQTCGKTGAAAFDPARPERAGYELVFNDEFGSIDTIDVRDTRRPGFKWYVGKFFPSYKTTPASAIGVADGILTISASDSTNWQLATAAPDRAGRGHVGQAFGRGFYVEARIAFDHRKVVVANGWPAFWASSLEALLGRAQWPGQPPGYDHAIEDDIFEYDVFGRYGPNSFGSSLHDWYGIRGVTCALYCRITSPNAVVRLGKTDWTEFHTVGQLYVPGDETNGFEGSVVTYFDGVRTSASVAWTYRGHGVPPPGARLHSA